MGVRFIVELEEVTRVVPTILLDFENTVRLDEVKFKLPIAFTDIFEFADIFRDELVCIKRLFEFNNEFAYIWSTDTLDPTIATFIIL